MSQSCPQKEIDFGGCRCQAALLTGSAGEHRSGLRSLAATGIALMQFVDRSTALANRTAVAIQEKS